MLMAKKPEEFRKHLLHRYESNLRIGGLGKKPRGANGQARVSECIDIITLNLKNQLERAILTLKLIF